MSEDSKSKSLKINVDDVNEPVNPASEDVGDVVDNNDEDIKPEYSAGEEVEYTNWGSGTPRQETKTVWKIDSNETIPKLIDAIKELRKELKQVKKQLDIIPKLEKELQQVKDRADMAIVRPTVCKMPEK